METFLHPGSRASYKTLQYTLKPAGYSLFFTLALFFTATAFAQKKTVTSKQSQSKNIKEALIKRAAFRTVKSSLNTIWFQKNEGQFGNPKVQYGFRTSFGSMGVYKNKLRVITEQKDDSKKIGQQIVDISFPGSTAGWKIVPGKTADVKGTFNTATGSITAPIYNEITLKNVYEGIDLRLYSGEQGALEFDWLVSKAELYKKIRLNFTGQDEVSISKNGNIVLDMRKQDMKIVIPETYQFINGHKKRLNTHVKGTSEKNTFQYDIAGNFNPALPLVIDPVMTWSTYMHNNTSNFDEYLYAIAVNTSSEVYACGLTNEAISTAYMSGVAPGFISTYTFGINGAGDQESVILYKLNPKGTAITAWTYTGETTNIPVAMGIFPNNRVLVVYQTDMIQIFSADLTTRHYSANISADLGNNVLSYQSQAIIDDDVFYLGGIAETALPSSIIPAAAPDNTISRNEGIILRINGASTTPYAEWGTYVGGSANESFTAIAATPDKSKITFAVHVNGSGSGYPLLINEVDNITANNELLIGVIDTGMPTTFNVFSFLGGSGNEGRTSDETAAALVAADNNFFYVAGNTTSPDIPGTTGAAQPNHGVNLSDYDQFVSQIPLDGSVSPGFITTYNGGNASDVVGGLVVDLRTHDVLLFGSTESTDFPVYNASAYSPFYQPVHGNTSRGPLDISYTVFANGLKTRKFSSYIGGAHNDYLGSTGKLQGTGHFQYNPTNGLTYIGTTIHSDQTTLPTQWMSDLPGFDKSIPVATTTKDNHYIFSMNPNTDDFGDAPASYDSVSAASSAVSFFDIRIGDETDPEEGPNSSVLADGDDLQNFGSTDDEDGATALPSIPNGATTYSVVVKVFNHTGAAVKLYGWIDTDVNGAFDINEFTSSDVPDSNGTQLITLNFTGLPPYDVFTGYTYLRLRIANVTLTAADAKGAFGKGEVEDYVVLGAAILPVKLEQFTAMQQDKAVQLNWLVSKANDIDRFELQRGKNITQFSSMQSVAAGNKQQFSYLDASPENGSNYYRLRIVYKDGSVRYSNVQLVKFNNSTPLLVYPNPASNMVNIATGNWANKPGHISLVNIEGKIISLKKSNSFQPVESIDVSHYPRGTYIVRIASDDKVVSKKIQIIKN